MRNLAICFVFSFFLPGMVLAQDAAPSPKADGQPQVVEYRVQKGETLGRIAKAHGLSWNAFVKLNQHIKDFNKVDVGMLVYLPAPKAAKKEEPSAQVPAEKPAAKTSEDDKPAVVEPAPKTSEIAKETQETDAVGDGEAASEKSASETEAGPGEPVVIDKAAPISDNEMEGKVEEAQEQEVLEDIVEEAQEKVAETAKLVEEKEASAAALQAAQEVKGEGPIVYRANGYIRLGYSTFTTRRFFGIRMPANDDVAKNPHVGRNDGFSLSDARLNFRTQYKDSVSGRLSFDGALVTYDDTDSPVGHLSTGFKDAYLSFPVSKKMSLIAGRFKPPFDVEELTSTRDQWFVHRALESRGVKRHEGFSADMQGMAPGRQVGLMLAADRPGLWDSLGLGYALALTNGNSGDESLNDNDLPAFWMRMYLSWSRAEEKSADGEEGPATAANKGGTLGLSAYVNESTLGLAPNRFHDRVYGGGLDVSANYRSLFFRAQALGTLIQHLLSGGGTPQQISLGGHAQLGFKLPKVALYPSYRFAYYNPRFAVSDDEVKDEGDFAQVMHQTLGLRYMPDDKPWTFVAEYTHSAEQSGRAIANDRVEAAFQVNF